MISLKKLAAALVSLGHLDKAPKDPAWEDLKEAYGKAGSLPSNDVPLYRGEMLPGVLAAYEEAGGPEEEAKFAANNHGSPEPTDAEGNPIQEVELHEFMGNPEETEDEEVEAEETSPAKTSGTKKSDPTTPPADDKSTGGTQPTGQQG